MKKNRQPPLPWVKTSAFDRQQPLPKTGQPRQNFPDFVLYGNFLDIFYRFHSEKRFFFTKKDWVKFNLIAIFFKPPLSRDLMEMENQFTINKWC